MTTSARREMLEAGIALLHERGVVTGVTHIRLARVAKRAGYTTGAAYRFWPAPSRSIWAGSGWRSLPVGACTTSARLLTDGIRAQFVHRTRQHGA
ncbi:MAG: hypothetical protein WKF58_18025 [Ilumatobacteraceae bacterium]